MSLCNYYCPSLYCVTENYGERLRSSRLRISGFVEPTLFGRSALKDLTGHRTPWVDLTKAMLPSLSLCGAGRCPEECGKKSRSAKNTEISGQLSRTRQTGWGVPSDPPLPSGARIPYSLESARSQPIRLQGVPRGVLSSRSIASADGFVVKRGP